jgi:hypothetical protein
VRELEPRDAHGLSSIVRNGEPVTSGPQSVPFQAGYPRTPRSPHKGHGGYGPFLALALGLVLFTLINLPVARPCL